MEGNIFSWSQVLTTTGIGLMVFLSGSGSAMGVKIGASALIGSLKKRPEIFGTGLVLAGMPATQGLYGFVAFFLYNNAASAELSFFQAAVIFAAGCVMGITALVSAVQQGKVCANGLTAMGGGHNVFGNTLILGAFPEFYAILALVAAILMQGLL
jgi:V/A-type H+-transporting ATPase subunit K